MAAEKKIIQHHQADIPPEALDNALAVMKSAWLKGNTFKRDLEKAVESDFSQNGAIATHTGSIALFAALKALPKAGDVVLPAYLCGSVAAAIRMAGCSPLFCDVVAHTGMLDPADVARRWRKTVRAIIVPHLFGNYCDPAQFRNFGVPIIEDAAQLPGDPRLGRDSDVMVLSFEGTKLLCAGECGLVAWRNIEIGESLQRRVRDEEICSLSPTDLQCGVALAQWGHRENAIAARRARAEEYTRQLAGSGVEPVADAHSTFLRYVAGNCANVDSMIQKGAAAGITFRRPVTVGGYEEMLLSGTFPGWSQAYRDNLSVPIHNQLTGPECVSIMRFVAENYEAART